MRGTGMPCISEGFTTTLKENRKILATLEIPDSRFIKEASSILFSMHLVGIHQELSRL